MDGQLIGGFALAAGAAGCYESAYALLALEARRASARKALRPALLGHLARRPLWVGGIFLGAAGWPLQLLALSLAPLTLVQPTLALGLLLLLGLGTRVLGESVGRRELAAVAAIVIGVAGIAAAAPDRTTEHGSTTLLVAALTALGAVTALPYLVRSAGRMPRRTMIVSAGAGDAWAAFAAKLVVDELSGGHWLAALALALGAGAALGVGLLSEMTALQSYAATRVGPVVLVLQVTIPVLLAPLVGGERWGDTPLGGGVLIASLAVVAGSTAALASSSAVGSLLSGEGEHERSRGG